jgi:FKBP-type peptidyl-prolyl cis-trans isomerase FklB
MKKTLRSILIMGIGAGLLQAAAAADNKPGVPPPPAKPPAAQPPVAPHAPQAPKLLPGFKDQKEQMSYSIGMSVAQTIKQSLVDLDMDVITGAMKDFLAGKTMRMTDEQVTQGIQAWRTIARAKQQEELARTSEKNRKAGDAFLAENKKKEGVKTHTVTLAGGKTAELQYKIITEGTGAIPKSNDTVNVKFRGMTIDGKQFDSSTNRGPGSLKIPIARTPFRGWSEAWQMMKVGSKWELYLPSTLAGGDRPVRPNVEPGSTLIYEMELTGIEPPPAPRVSTNNPAPLTSDIIKVPSLEQINKGAQPKIMKPEDIEKEMQKEKKQQ